MIDQTVNFRSDDNASAKRIRWGGATKLLQPIACAVCAVLLVTEPARQQTLHAAAPQVGNRAAKKDDAENWTDVQQWMQKNCINQWTFYNRKLADRPGQQQHAKKLMIDQYQRVMAAKDPQMRDALTLQATFRDNIFGIVLDYKRGQLKRPAAQSQIENWENKLADIEIFVRTARINELKNEIADLQQRRQQHVAQLAVRDLNQADLPPARINATGDASPLLEETADKPATKSGSTTRPATR